MQNDCGVHPVIFNPELAAAALKNNESEYYALWCMLKSVNHDGSGRVKIKGLLEFIKVAFGVKSSRAYEKINDGVGLYWNKIGTSKGEKVTTLIGKPALINRLCPTLTRSEPFEFKIQDIILDTITTRELKHLMIAIVAGRYVDERPVSIQSVMQQTGLSKSTIQRALRDCVDLKSLPNYEQISTHNSELSARKALAKIPKSKSPAYKIEQRLDQFVVIRRLPNTWTLVSPKRLPLRKRSKDLKKRDVENSSNIEKKRYFPKNSKKEVRHEHLTLNNITILSTGSAGVWTGKNARKLKEPKRSLMGKWQDAKQQTCAKTVQNKR